MSVPLRFLVDENLPAGIAAVLSESGQDVLDIAASDRRGDPDDALWKVAIHEDRIIVTRDLDFPLPSQLGRPAGVVLLRTSGMRTSELVQFFRDALARLDLQSLRDCVTVIEPGRVRQRRYAKLPR